MKLFKLKKYTLEKKVFYSLINFIYFLFLNNKLVKILITVSQLLYHINLYRQEIIYKIMKDNILKRLLIR